MTVKFLNVAMLYCPVIQSNTKGGVSVKYLGDVIKVHNKFTLREMILDNGRGPDSMSYWRLP